MPKSLKELIDNADKYADAFEAYEPTGGEEQRLSPELALQLAVFRRAQAEKDVAAAVEAARAVDLSWAKIGVTLGTSGEAARQRYSSV
ncbi:hypothetical protein [Aeromicrobium alkaliterrae]|uniref:Uncharacterized protein n=1 Tax=Aeromicrobium alkaliterrae TaxID=302168 RepID=A0ABN2JVI4_9ACTN